MSILVFPSMVERVPEPICHRSLCRKALCSTTPGSILCQACKLARYCTFTCLVKDKELHRTECKSPRGNDQIHLTPQERSEAENEVFRQMQSAMRGIDVVFMRTRVSGVPVTSFYCKKTAKAFLRSDAKSALEVLKKERKALPDQKLVLVVVRRTSGRYAFQVATLA